MSFKPNHFLQSVLLLLLLVSASCTSDQAAEEAVVDYKRTTNDVLVHAKAEPDRLNPMLTVNSYASRALKYIFTPLVGYDPEELVLKPVLAKSLPERTVPESGPYAGTPAFTYEIREEAVWDNGSPVLASDYVFTLKAMFNPAVQSNVYRSILGFIVDAEIDSENPRRFTVYTNEVNMNASYYAGWYVYPEYIYDPEGLMKDIALSELTDPYNAKKLLESDERIQQFAEAFNSPKFAREKGFVAGSGAYSMEHWITGQELKLIRKKNWWGDRFSEENNLFKAGPDQITYVFIPDENTAVATLKDEGLDIMGVIPEKQFQELAKNEAFMERYNLYRAPTLSTGYIGLNTESPKLDDKRVRQAVAYSLDMDEMIQILKNGEAIKCVGPVNPNMPYHKKDLNPYTQDIEKAKALLEEAGWTDSNKNGIVDKEIDGEQTELNIKILVPVQSEVMKNIALMIADYGKLAGIGFELTNIDFNVMLGQDVPSGNFEAFILSASADLSWFNPYQYFHSESQGNYSRFRSDVVDKIIEELITTPDDERRMALYDEFQEIINEEQPWVYLYSTKQGIAVHKRFDNVKVTTARPGYYESNFELKDKYIVED